MAELLATKPARRLEGCHARSLDAYLRGLGLLFAADAVVDDLRSAWSEDGVLIIYSTEDLDALVLRLVEAAVTDTERVFGSIATPWRGKAGRERSFAQLRNEAPDAALAWFDACALPRLDGRGSSDKRNNPLLGQGGGFGRSELAAAFADAGTLLIKRAGKPEALERALAALLSDEPLERRDARAVAVSNKVLGAYQSGRATGPGASRVDVEPTGQRASTSAWDLMLVIAGLSAFSGSTSRRPDPGATIQASFPLLVRARAAGLDDANARQLRTDGDDTYELLAPLWSAPARLPVVYRRLATLRLRAGGSIARDAAEATVAHAAVSARGVGFDRLVRFVLAAPSDPRYRYALRRGVILARGSRAADLVARDMVPFLRAVDARPPKGDRRPEGLARARHGLDEAAVRVARADPQEQAQALRALVVALVAFERIAARTYEERSLASLPLARLGRAWQRAMAAGDDADWRLSRSLAWAASVGGSSWLRAELLPHRRTEKTSRPGPDDGAQRGRGAASTQAAEMVWRLDSDHGSEDLLHSSQPLVTLLRSAIAVARSPRDELDFAAASARLSDVAALLGSDGPAGDMRLVEATIAAARLDAPPDTPERAPGETPARHGIGRALAVVLLAGQPAGDRETLEEGADESRGTSEPHATVMARRAELAQLALAGANTRGDASAGRSAHASGRAALLRLANRELWRRGLDVAPPAADALTSLPSERLAAALLLGVEAGATEALHEQFSPSPREGVEP